MKMFDAGKTRMIGLLHGEKKNCDNIILSRFYLIPESYGQTDTIARQCADAR